MSVVWFRLCFQSYQPVIRKVVVEHDRTYIRQSGYILDRPCDNFQDIYSDMYTCSLVIKEHEPEKAATEMVQRGGRQTCISGYVIRAVKQQMCEMNTLHNLQLGLFGKRPVDQGGFQVHKGRSSKNHTDTNFPSYLSIFPPHLSVLLHRTVGCKNGSPSHSLQNHKGKIATSFLPPTQI